MVTNKLERKIVVTGGGSGGHISSASAIISAIQERYSNYEENLLYIGSDLGMEGEKNGISLEKKFFQNETFKQEYIRTGKMQRRFSLSTLILMFRTILGFIDSYKILKNFRPDIVISTGGFVTVPVCLVAKIFKAKIYLHEQTAAVGLANKIVSRYAEKIFTVFPSSEKYFPKNKTIRTGNLVRKEIFLKSGKGPIIEPLKKMIAQQEQLPIIYISGGGLGSHIINETVKDSLINLLQDFQIVLQTGDNNVNNDYDSLMQEKLKLDPGISERFFPVKYITNEEIGFLFSNIDMFVGRAGANTVYEMGLLRIPSILIPIPWVTHNEQEKNAEILVDTGLGIIIKEGELTPEKLGIEIKSFYKRNKVLDENKLKEIFVLNASDKILDSIKIN